MNRWRQFDTLAGAGSNSLMNPVFTDEGHLSNYFKNATLPALVCTEKMQGCQVGPK